ncbi:Phosphoglycerate mutase [Burkholderia sp. 8Y]|uniref:alpha-ribazole phosphatase family protein n=1 Tax=Burkholderia sp. 8Y TaxID=2653133 RepID=UPI0012F0988E|nr:alpha-ribazole phosphatase family protein [Burkholderia sp. 8Y]VXB64540.1 Phosphoglycerate mutase [Burkholderia sp. 8Y]
MDLVLIRHPAVAVDEGVCYGQTDVPLARDAQASALELDARLRVLDVPACVDGWHTSPLRRCASLAEALGAARIDARLAELYFGAWEGRAWNDIDRALIDAWAADVEHARPHGGESLAQFSERVTGWFDETCSSASDAVHVIAHAGVVRVLAAHLLRVDGASALQWPLAFGGIVQLRRVDTVWALVRWNA